MLFYLALPKGLRLLRAVEITQFNVYTGPTGSLGSCHKKEG
jgi:hypothetical protein